MPWMLLTERVTGSLFNSGMESSWFRVVEPARMDQPINPPDPAHEHDLTPRQERLWFHLWTAGLVVVYLGLAGALVWKQHVSRLRDEVSHAAQLDSGQADPGLTGPETGSTEAALRVHCGTYVDRLINLSIRDSKWTVEFDVWFRWEGPPIDLTDSLVIVAGSVQSKERVDEFHQDDQHYLRYRIVAEITQVFDITRFPCDSHLLILGIENAATVRDRWLFVADVENAAVSSRVRIPGYRIAGFKALEKPHSYKTSRGDPRLTPGTKATYSQLRFATKIQRPNLGLYLKMFQGLFVAVAISMLAFFIRPVSVDPRFGLGVGALFAAVANAYLVGSYVPDTGAVALADVVNLIGVGTILATLIESTVSLYLYETCHEVELSQRFDRVSFAVLGGGYVLVNLTLPLVAT